MLSLFARYGVLDPLEHMLEEHVWCLPLRECIRDYPEYEIVSKHPEFTPNKAMLRACNMGYLELVKQLHLKAGAGLDFVWICDKVDVAKYLVENGGTITKPHHPMAQRPLYYAVEYSYFDMVKYIVEVAESRGLVVSRRHLRNAKGKCYDYLVNYFREKIVVRVH
jgi:hypothetical protein